MLTWTFRAMARKTFIARHPTISISKGSLSTFPTVIPADLEYDEYVPADGNEQRDALVILHGLMGSKRNWLSLAKAFAKDLKRPIYTLDLRNHGSSPHCLPMTYHSMAQDVLHFCKRKNLSNISLLGHSMGGKVAMTFALSPELPPGILENLIIADIASSKGDMSLEFKVYIQGMKKVEASKISTRNEASDILIDYEKDPAIRAFLLTNLIPASSGNQFAKFRIPLNIIEDAISELGTFPYEPGERSWDGKTLLVKGSKSKYVNRHNIPLTKQYFPKLRLETLEAGHWVHAESPNEFKKLVTDFITEKA